jgi:hypothetical protein
MEVLKTLTATGPLVRTVPAVSVPVAGADQRHAVAGVALELVDRASLARRRRVQRVRTVPRVSSTAAGRRSRADAVGLVCPVRAVRVPVADPRLVDAVLPALARELGRAAAPELVLHVGRAVHSPVAPIQRTPKKKKKTHHVTFIIWATQFTKVNGLG